MNELLNKIKAGSDHKKETVWPGMDVKINIHVANEQNNLDASLATDKLFKDTTIGIANIDDYNGERETQLLFRVLKDPETGNPVFNNITDFRNLLTPEIKNILADELDSLHEESSPDPAKMTEDQFDKLINDVKKNVDLEAGNISSIFIARKLITYLVSQPTKSQTGNGSTS